MCLQQGSSCLCACLEALPYVYLSKCVGEAAVALSWWQVTDAFHLQQNLQHDPHEEEGLGQKRAAHASTLMRSRGATAVLAAAPDPPIATRCKENSLKLSNAPADHVSWTVAAAKGCRECIHLSDSRGVRSGQLFRPLIGVDAAYTFGAAYGGQ